MPKVDVVNEVPIARSFRVDQAAGMFDVSLEAKSRVRIRGEVPGVEEAWTLGAIIGPSGSGKGTVARSVYGDAFLEQVPGRSSPFEWDRDAAIVDGFGEAGLREVTALLGSVGLASPPAWVRPYRVLSTGQRFRADLARALMLDQDLVVFDEFGGTVSEDVANVCAATVSKSVRRGRCRVKRFVAVGARDNFVEWLDPEWVLDMRTEPGRLTWRARGSVRQGGSERGDSAPAEAGRPGPGSGRPGIEFGVWRGSRSAWPLFRGHHYLSSVLNRSARVYLGRVRLPGRDWETVGFCATLHNAGFSGYRMVHRLVVLPDWQGIGIGPRLLESVAAVEAVTGPLSIRTSHPGLIHALDRSERWGVNQQYDGTVYQKTMRTAGSFGRVTVGFVWRGSVEG